MPGLSESTYPQGPVLVDGLYPITLKEVKEYTKTYDGKDSDRLAWIFDVEADESAVDDSIEIEDDDYKFSGHFEIAAHTGVTKSKKANSNWAKLNMDVIVPEDCKNTDDLIGVEAIGYVSSYEGNDGLTKNTIEKISKPKEGKTAGKSNPVSNTANKRDPVDLNEEDFNDIPFRHMSIKRLAVEGIL